MPSLFSKGLNPGLYAITDSGLLSDERIRAAVEAAVLGGAVLIQYRDKHSSDSTRLRQARDLAAICRNARVPLVINDDPLLAKRAGANGVHLGQSDGSLSHARQLLGDDAIIGATCHSDLALAETACHDTADYLAFGRFYGSSTKPDAPAADLSILSEAYHFRRPLTAIGGVNLENGPTLIRAGADMLAVVGGLFGVSQARIEQRARDFTRLFAAHHPLFQATAHSNAMPKRTQES